MNLLAGTFTVLNVTVNMGEESDERLMALVVDRDVAAYRALYNRYAAVVKGLAYKIVGDEGAAEEIVQESFWRIWANADSFDARRGSFANWLFGIARNQSIDMVRRQARARVEVWHDEPLEEATAVARLADDHDVPESAQLAMQEKQVRAALALLPAEQREVIHWIYFQGRTRREIAQSENIAFGTINTRARLALDKLRRALEVHELGA